MPEIELNLVCDNCGSSCRVMFDNEQVNYDPENCPFCGEIVGIVDDELLDYSEEDENEEEDGDDNNSWD